MKRLVQDALPPRRASSIRPGAWSAALGALLSFVVAGCAGSLDPGVTGNGGTGGSGGGGCEVALLNNQCVSCHGATSNSAGLDLQSSGLGARLVGQMSFMGMCSGKILLDPGSSPATGFFIDKITNDPPSCGVVMPFGLKMGASDIACLTTYATTLTTGAP